MFWFLHRNFFITVKVLAAFMLIILWRCWSTSRNNDSVIRRNVQPPQIVWWTSMPAGYESTRYCGLNVCTFTAARTNWMQAKAILFYASDLKIDQLPIPRSPDHMWALLHEESPRNVPYIPHAEVLRHFNFTSTFSRYSDYPLTLHYLPRAEDLTSPTYLVPIGQKALYRVNKALAPIVFLQSDCDTMSGRDDYVHELMKHIDIDSYGKCLHNRHLPISLRKDYLNNLYSPELLHFLARYKFILAYENGICEDYITEKFWRPLIVGAIPIYFGSPTIRDWQPTKKSVIHISEFMNPKALADYIKRLDRNDTAYNAYLDHKYNVIEPISNKRLQLELEGRDYSIANGNLFNSFECFICRQLHEMPEELVQTSNLNHYRCPLPLIYPPPLDAHSVSNSAAWSSVMTVGRCQARILNQLLHQNKNYTKEDFNKLLLQQVNLNKCNS